MRLFVCLGRKRRTKGGTYSCSHYYFLYVWTTTLYTRFANNNELLHVPSSKIISKRLLASSCPPPHAKLMAGGLFIILLSRSRVYFNGSQGDENEYTRKQRINSLLSQKMMITESRRRTSRQRRTKVCIKYTDRLR